MNADFYISQLEDVFNGSPWHSEPIIETLNKVDYSTMNDKPLASVHSMAELVEHMIAWRRYCMEKLSGNADFDLRGDSPEDWKPLVMISSSSDKKELVDRFQQSQKDLIRVLEQADAGLFASQVPGRTFSYHHMMIGIIYHDIYHQGQISLLHRQLS